MHWKPRITAATALSVLGYLHLHLAPAYDAASSGAIHGVALRGVAALGVVCAVAVLQFDHLAVHLAGLTAACVSTAVVTTHGWIAQPGYGPIILGAAAVAIAATGYLAATRAAAALRHRNLRVALGAYVLGGVDAQERGDLDAHLQGCARCRAEVTTLAPVAGLLSRADPALVVDISEPWREAMRPGSHHEITKR